MLVCRFYELVRKPIPFCDRQTRRVKRKSEVTKNQLLRQMLRTCQQNRLSYRYVLADSWFAAKENLLFIRQDLKKHFIVALKSNRTVALSPQDKAHGRFVRIDTLDWSNRLDQRTAFSRPAASASLYKQRRFHRHFVSGL